MGKTIVVSSHILSEIERIPEQIVILHTGRLIAFGNLHAIRDLLDKHPHRISLTTEQPRELASKFLNHESVYGVHFPSKNELLIETHDLGKVHNDMPFILDNSGIRVTAIENPDDNLESILEYLMEGR